jgi:2-keto-4-pentenoate hydratase/2-oxohepta-3-ene-1,7-dioic acid hydratase in catechol pathway
MKIVRYQNQLGQIEHGALDASGKTFKLRGDIFDKPEITTEPATVAKLLAPLAPVTILGIGLNYRKHAAESGAKIPEYPVLFVKGLNTLQNPNDPIEIPTFLKSDEVDYECELAVVIGKRCKNVRRADALKYVLGYTCGNDISASDWQRQ